MKTVFIFFIFTFYLNANELAWVDEQVQAIQPPRDGIGSEKVSLLQDPFIFLEKNKSKKEDKEDKRDVNVLSVPFSTPNILSAPSEKKAKKVYLLSAVINSSALINGNWYKVGDAIGSYKVSKIEKTSAVLSKKDKTLVLSTMTKIKNLKFKN